MRLARKRLKMSQDELAGKIGVARQTISSWENNASIPNSDDLKKIAAILNTTVAYLIGESDDKEIRRTSYYYDQLIEIPIMDASIVACAGAGNGWVEEVAAQTEKYIHLPKETIGPIGVNGPFAVKVEGDSMEAAGINDGAIVAINPEAEIYDGDVVLVAFGIMRQVAVKWIYFRRDGSIELRSANSAYQPLIFSKEDIEQDMVRVLGKVVCVVNKPKRGI
jgi:repressor LexA